MNVKVEEIRKHKSSTKYEACPDCGFPLSPSNMAIKEGLFRDTITKGKECMKCGYKIKYTYKLNQGFYIEFE